LKVTDTLKTNLTLHPVHADVAGKPKDKLFSTNCLACPAAYALLSAIDHTTPRLKSDDPSVTETEDCESDHLSGIPEVLVTSESSENA
jgi:hypothetical protein